MSDPATNTERHEKRWTPEQALSLFKDYEDRGWQAKQQMISIVVWLTPIIFGLIAYSVKSYCEPASTSTSASPASLAALALSAVMSALIWGTLKRADNIYAKADEVICKAKATGVLSSPIYEIVKQPRRASRGPCHKDMSPNGEEEETKQEQKKEKWKRLIKDLLIYCLRLGLIRIARVYISFVYLSAVFLVLSSFGLWWRPQRTASMLCESVGSLIEV
jgi:hypothetical protein